EEARVRACILIQAAIRGFLTRRAVSLMLKKAAAVDVISRAWKAYFFRMTINCLIYNRKLRNEKAATIIQATWRGYRIRKEKLEANKRLEEARRRISEQIRVALPCMTLGVRTTTAIDKIEQINRHNKFSSLGDHLDILIMTSRLSPD